MAGQITGGKVGGIAGCGQGAGNAGYCESEKIGERKEAKSCEAALRSKETSNRAQAKVRDTTKDVAQGAGGPAVTDTEERGGFRGHTR